MSNSGAGDVQTAWAPHISISFVSFKVRIRCFAI